jgi:hypothetical protein
VFLLRKTEINRERKIARVLSESRSFGRDMPKKNCFKVRRAEDSEIEKVENASKPNLKP